MSRLVAWVVLAACAFGGYQLYRSGIVDKYLNQVKPQGSRASGFPQQGDARSIVESGKLYDAEKRPGEGK